MFMLMHTHMRVRVCECMCNKNMKIKPSNILISRFGYTRWLPLLIGVVIQHISLFTIFDKLTSLFSLNTENQPVFHEPLTAISPKSAIAGSSHVPKCYPRLRVTRVFEPAQDENRTHHRDVLISVLLYVRL